MFKKTFALFAALAMISIGPLSAQAHAAGGVYLRTQLAPYRALDAVPSEVHNNGGKVHMWTLWYGEPQLWYWVGNTLRPAADTSMCLEGDPVDTRDGAPVRLWKCNGGNNQVWYKGTQENIYLLVPRKCLDVNPNTNWDGGQVYLWQCNGSVQQKWYQNAG